MNETAEQLIEDIREYLDREHVDLRPGFHGQRDDFDGRRRDDFRRRCSELRRNLLREGFYTRPVPIEALDMFDWLAEAENAQPGDKTSETAPDAGTHTASGEPDADKTPTPAERRAWQSYAWVCQTHPDLIPQNSGTKYTRKMYDAAMESPLYVDDDGHPITRPLFGSWKRNLRGYVAKAPKRPDTQADLRPEEIANRENTDDLTAISNRFGADS